MRERGERERESKRETERERERGGGILFDGPKALAHSRCT